MSYDYRGLEMKDMMAATVNRRLARDRNNHGNKHSTAGMGFSHFFSLDTSFAPGLDNAMLLRRKTQWVSTTGFLIGGARDLNHFA